MVKITLDNIFPNEVPAEGWKVGYRKLGGTTWIVPPGSPFKGLPIEFTTLDPAGTMYEGYVQSDCGDIESPTVTWKTGCNCSDDFTVASDGVQCVQVDNIEPKVYALDNCLATAQHTKYARFGTRVYRLDFTVATINTNLGVADPLIDTILTTPYWCNSTQAINLGPFNREGVWIDSDCDGNRNSLVQGQETTIGFVYQNSVPNKIVYVGISADTEFKFKMNGVTVADTTLSGSGMGGLNLFHLFPVKLIVGYNYFNAIGIGDGTLIDAIGMLVFDNTVQELKSATSDADLDILFQTGKLRRQKFDITTCDEGYSLDTSGGAGNYRCMKYIYKICNSKDT